MVKRKRARGAAEQSTGRTWLGGNRAHRHRADLGLQKDTRMEEKRSPIEEIHGQISQDKVEITVTLKSAASDGKEARKNVLNSLLNKWNGKYGGCIFSPREGDLLAVEVRSRQQDVEKLVISLRAEDQVRISDCGCHFL